MSIYVSKLSGGMLKEHMSEGIVRDSDLKYSLNAVIDAARDLATRFDADRVPLSTSSERGGPSKPKPDTKKRGAQTDEDLLRNCPSFKLKEHNAANQKNLHRGPMLRNPEWKPKCMKKKCFPKKARHFAAECPEYAQEVDADKYLQAAAKPR